MSGASMTGFQRLAEGNVAFLEQGAELIGRLSDDQYAITPATFLRGGVGPHFRHILDHYDCFLDGLDRGRVDYDARPRDSRTERERRVALSRIADTCRRLRALDPRLASAPIQATLSCAEPPGTRPLWSATSVVRELQFLASHTVHHYAVIAAMLRPQGVEPGADFGVAPSTLEYERENAACAR
jgi:uncharacterized damage-inducible protein DinB